jgi:hypothetical protein
MPNKAAKKRKADEKRKAAEEREPFDVSYANKEDIHADGESLQNLYKVEQVTRKDLQRMG